MKKEIEKQRDQLHSIKALYDSEGGKELVRLYCLDIVGIVHRLSNAKDESHIELLAMCKELKILVDTARLLVNSEKSLEIIDKEIEEALLTE